MADGPLHWLRALWAYVDERLASTAKALQRVVRMLRVARFLLLVGILVVLASAVIGIWWPQYFAYAFAAAALVLVIPLVMLMVLVGLPLRAKSIVRLIDQGYPDNAREMAIRVAARKLRDQSIETEELLVETAVNEGRKVYERYKARAEAMDAAATDADPEAAPHDKR